MPGREINRKVEKQETVWSMTQKAGQRVGGRGRQERTERGHANAHGLPTKTILLV